MACALQVGPAFLIESVQLVLFANLNIIGWHTGVVITDSADVRFTNCAVMAQANGGGADDVDMSPSGCDGCNVVFGSNNTALVVENSFWIFAEDSSFFFYPSYLVSE